MKPATRGPGYTRVAVSLHWLIALLIVLNLALGFWMHAAIEDPDSRSAAVGAFQWHKSLGLLILGLSLLRGLWRLRHPPPPHPTGGWQGRLAGAVHGLLYLLMLLIPLSGWLMVSAQWRGEAPLTVPTFWFGLLEVPDLLSLAVAPEWLRQLVWGLSLRVHESLVWTMIVLLCGHVGAALWHLRSSPPVFRMTWRQPPAASPTRSGRVVWGVVAMITVFACLLFATPFQGSTTAGATGDGQSEPPGLAALDARITADLPRWQVLHESSHIQFNGEQASKPFSGHFGHWEALIAMNPEQPATAQLAVRVKTGSATDGVPLHDRTLKEAEWFDVARHPWAAFDLSEATPTDQGAVQLTGTLRIKDRSVLVSGLSMTVEGAAMRIRGAVVLDRAQLDLGMRSDPDGDFVSRYIQVDIQVLARRTE